MQPTTLLAICSLGIGVKADSSHYREIWLGTQMLLLTT